jgi:hypothetical protein
LGRVGERRSRKQGRSLLLLLLLLLTAMKGVRISKRRSKKRVVMLLMESMIVHKVRRKTWSMSARETASTAEHRSHMLVKQVVHMSILVIREKGLIY